MTWGLWNIFNYNAIYIISIIVVTGFDISSEDRMPSWREMGLAK